MTVIAVCMASRGTGHIRTLAGLIREVEPYPHVWCWAFGLPLTEAVNSLVAQALAHEQVSHVLFAEDDHLWPVGGLASLLAEDADIAAINYPLRSGRSCAIWNRAGEPVLVGLGLTLIRREVFARVPAPPFQVGNRMQWDGDGWKDSGLPEHAGGQDVWLCRAARAAGCRIAVVAGMEAGHLDLVRRGDHVNFGMDEIICHGGAGLPWYPERRPAMPVVWVKSPDGAIAFDLDTEKGGDPDWYLRRGWSKITATEAKPIIRQQQEANAAALARSQAREEDLKDGGRG